MYEKTMKEGVKYKVIFINILMPIMNGKEVVAMIIAIERSNNHPKAFICGLVADKEELGDNYIEQGINDYIPKPFDTKRIRKLVLENIGLF
jgi:response regulator RpfG family c-di-GMP phosphodiesterase